MTAYRCCDCGEVTDGITAALDHTEAHDGGVSVPAEGPRWRHGSASTYRNHGCRCQACTAAHTEKCAQGVAARRGVPIPAHVGHGKVTTYNNWSCRCDDCTAAIASYRRAWRARKKAEAQQ